MERSEWYGLTGNLDSWPDVSGLAENLQFSQLSVEVADWLLKEMRYYRMVFLAVEFASGL